MPAHVASTMHPHAAVSDTSCLPPAAAASGTLTAEASRADASQAPPRAGTPPRSSQPSFNRPAALSPISAEASMASMVRDVTREPAIDLVPKSNRDLPLRLSAVADNAKYECEAGPIAFRPTMMFQTRSYSFVLANKGLGRMPFR
jgi:hydrocephalus-inducing protein